MQPNEQQLYEIGVEHFNKGEHKEAADIFSTLKNHAEAQFALARCYDEGWGVNKDPKQAFELFKIAAELGNRFAYAQLGYRYQHALGVGQNYQEAAEMYKRGAELGDEVARYHLAGCYAQGRGVELSLVRAAEIYQAGANNGYAPAKRSLGDCYREGLGVPKNLQTAAALYQQLAEQGDDESQYALAQLYQEGGEGFPKNFQRAAELYQDLADKREDELGQWALYKLGQHYYDGKEGGLERDFERAAKCYAEAARRGHELARGELQLLLEQMPALRGIIVPPAEIPVEERQKIDMELGQDQKRGYDLERHDVKRRQDVIKKEHDPDAAGRKRPGL